MKKTVLFAACVFSAVTALFVSCGSAKEVADADANAILEDEEAAEAARLAEEAARLAFEASLGKMTSSSDENGDIVLTVTLPENATAVNLYRKAEDEPDYQMVYQAWGKNENAKYAKGKKIAIIDYFVENGKKYEYKCNFRLLNDPTKVAYDKKNIGASESNVVSVIPVNGYGDFALMNTPDVLYDTNTSRMTFNILPKTNMDKVTPPKGLEKQPVKFVYVNPDLYSLWIFAPESIELPVCFSLGKIENIDKPDDPKAVMIDVPLRSDDGDGGWRLSIDKTSESSASGWTYEEHWFRKYTGTKYGLPATIVIPKDTVQKVESTAGVK